MGANEENIELTQHTSFKKNIGINAFVSTFGTSLLVQGFTMLQGVFVARLLGPEGRGQLAAIILWPTLISYLGLIGIDKAASRAIARERDNAIVSSALILSIILSCFSVVIGYFLLPRVIPDNDLLINRLATVYLFFVPVNQLFITLMAINQGRGDFFEFNVARLVASPVIIVSLLFTVVFYKASLESILISYVIGLSLALIILLVFNKKTITVKPTVQQSVQLLRSGLTFGLQRAVHEGYIRLDLLFIVWMLNPIDLGFYVIAFSACSLVTSATRSAGMVSFSRAANDFKLEGFDDIARVFRISVVTILLGGITLALILPILIPFVYGDNFSVSVSIVTPLIIGIIFSELAHLLDQSLQGYGRPKIGIVGRIFYMLVFAILSWPLGQVLGLSGFVYAYSISQGIYFVWSLTHIIKLFDQGSLLKMFQFCSDDFHLISKYCSRYIRKHCFHASY